MDGDIDGKDEIQQKHGQDEEVKRWIEASMVLEILRGWHGNPLKTRCNDAPQYSS